MRKGQMVFEFIIATLFFFAIIFYTLNFLNINLEIFGQDFYDNKLENKVTQISELVVGDQGVWAGGSPVVVGLAKKWPVLSYTKIHNLNQSCYNDYESIRQKFDVDYHMIKIQVNESGIPVPLLDCGDYPINTSRAGIKRYAMSENGNVLSVGVWIW